MNNINLQFPQHQHLNCPRCDSNNTKFCYYNNYNLTQPRHYCKNCRRYWTNGGTLRKIPIGGGTRKSSTNKRSSTSNKRPADSSICSSTAADPPPPAARLKPQGSAVLEFDRDRSVGCGGGFDSVLKSNNQGSFVDDLKLNLSDGSEKKGLNGTINGSEVFQVNYLSVSDDHNQCGGSSGGGAGGGAGAGGGGGDGWSNLSIFRSGENFR